MPWILAHRRLQVQTLKEEVMSSLSLLHYFAMRRQQMRIQVETLIPPFATSSARDFSSGMMGSYLSELMVQRIHQEASIIKVMVRSS